METQAPDIFVCSYCGDKFQVTDLLKTAKVLGIMQNDKPLFFCCKDHRRQMVEAHVAFEELHVEFNPEIHGDTIGPDHVRYSSDEPALEFDSVVDGLDGAQVRTFATFIDQLLGLSPSEQAIVRLRLAGHSNVEAAAIRKVSDQAASQRFLLAVSKLPALDALRNAAPLTKKSKVPTANIEEAVAANPTLGTDAIATLIGASEYRVRYARNRMKLAGIRLQKQVDLQA